MFINTTEELIPAEVDDVIEMEVDETMEKAVKRAVKGVAKILELEEPSEEKIGEALGVIENYVPAAKKPEDKNEKKKKADSARYYGLLPEVNLVEVLDHRLGRDDVDDDTKAAWEALKKEGRVTKRPHVTIVHRNSLSTEKALWDRCSALHAMSVTPPTFTGKLGRVMWNGRVMALTVDELSVDDAGQGSGEEGQDFIKKLSDEIRNRLHVTVGTKSGDIAPVEAKDMVQAWRGNSTGSTKVFELSDIVVRGRVKALMG